MFHHPQVSHHPSFLLASSNHCVCTLDQYRSKDVKCFSRLSAFCKGEIMGYKGIREMTLPFDHSPHLPVPKWAIFCLLLYLALHVVSLFLFLSPSEGFKLYLLCEAFPGNLFDYVFCVYVYPVSLPHWLWGERIHRCRIFFCGPEPGSQWALMKELMSE